MEPIITSLLDNDKYQFTMSQAFFYYGQKDEVVRFSFKNRSKIKLLSVIEYQELEEQIKNLFSLKFRFEELLWLKENLHLSKDFIDYLMCLTPPKLIMNGSDKELFLEYEGNITYSILYESMILAIINELFYKEASKLISHIDIESMMFQVLDEKIKFINNSNIDFIEFGTRRRYSKEWQRKVVTILKETTRFIKTSNLLLAKDLKLIPCGTMSHVWPMYWAAKSLEPFENLGNTVKLEEQRLKEEFLNSQIDAYKKWLDLEGSKGFYLTDTFGTDHFLKVLDNIPKEIICGFRQDSGDPFTQINKLKSYLLDRDISDRQIMASDGLKPEIIENLKFYSDIVFGWGTNLTNDGVFTPLSIVIKLCGIRKNGRLIPCVKLSDNVNKAVGDSTHIEIYKLLANYTNTTESEVIY